MLGVQTGAVSPAEMPGLRRNSAMAHKWRPFCKQLSPAFRLRSLRRTETIMARTPDLVNGRGSCTAVHSYSSRRVMVTCPSRETATCWITIMTRLVEFNCSAWPVGAGRYPGLQRVLSAGPAGVARLEHRGGAGGYRHAGGWALSGRGEHRPTLARIGQPDVALAPPLSAGIQAWMRLPTRGKDR